MPTWPRPSTFLEFYARQMRHLGRPQLLGQEPGELNHLEWLPHGIAVVISPWNFSLAIPTGMVAAALVTGNTVLFKPSERSPMMGYHLFDLYKEAGLPEGVLHLLPGGPDVGQALVAHPRIHVIAFTGSKEAGLQIIQQAAQSDHPVNRTSNAPLLKWVEKTPSSSMTPRTSMKP